MSVAGHTSQWRFHYSLVDTEDTGVSYNRHNAGVVYVAHQSSRPQAYRSRTVRLLRCCLFSHIPSVLFEQNPVAHLDWLQNLMKWYKGLFCIPDGEKHHFTVLIVIH